MKISTSRDDLLRPLQQVVGVVERRQTLPILANVLIGIADNQIAITATDLEVEIRKVLELCPDWHDTPTP